MMAVSDREFASLEAEVRFLREELMATKDAMKSLIDRIQHLDATLQQVRGGWVAIAGAAAIVITIGGLVLGFLRFFGIGRS